MYVIIKKVYDINDIGNENDGINKFWYQEKYIKLIINNIEHNKILEKINVYDINMGRGKTSVLLPGLI